MKGWRISQNEWNTKRPPWTGAICIEEADDDMAVPGIVCWTTRGECSEENAALIASAPAMAAELERLHEFLRRFHMADNRKASKIALLQDEASNFLPEAKS